MTVSRAQSGYAPVNGLQLYYEIHGAGEPIILLHGGFGTVTMMTAATSFLAEKRRVIVVEMQGHGHTADVDRPFTYEQLADDIAALIHHLGLGKADVAGYSLGGGVALQTAIRHPDIVRKLVVISAPHKRDGWYPEVLAGQAAVTGDLARTWVGSPMHEAYANVAPVPENWPTLADKTGDLLRRDYDWSEAVAAMTMPTLILLGDADSVRPADAVAMFELLGGGRGDGAMQGRPASQLAIMPDTTHFTILDRTDLLRPAIETFLDASQATESQA
jgi:pimeloyl-ACP methyl ester carboxylesterase